MLYSHDTIAVDKVDGHGLSNICNVLYMPGKEGGVDAVLAIERLLNSTSVTKVNECVATHLKED